MLFLLLLCRFYATLTAAIYTLSLHDALPIFRRRSDAERLSGRTLEPIFRSVCGSLGRFCGKKPSGRLRSEEHTSELQSLTNIVCRLLLEKKNATTGTADLHQPAPS